jgi:PAS domain S-box-containing protein
VATTTPGIVGRVWIIGGAGETTDWLAQLLSDQGHTVSVNAGPRSPGEPGHPPPDVVLLDAYGHPPQAIAALATLQASGEADSAVLVLLGEDPSAELLPIIAVTGADYLVWPTRDQEIIARVELALHRRERRRRVPPGIERAAPPSLAEAPRSAAASALFRHAFERIPLGAMIVSPANQIQYVNEALCRFTGYSPEELIGRQPGFMVTPEDHAATVARGHQLAAGQIDHFVQERRRYVRKDGALALGKLTVYAPRDEAGRPLAFLAFVEDIGSRVWAEDQLARYTRYQQALANASLCLLGEAPDATARVQALTRALQQLVDGAYASRAYLFRNVEDPQYGLAVVCAAEAWSAGGARGRVGDRPRNEDPDDLGGAGRDSGSRARHGARPRSDPGVLHARGAACDPHGRGAGDRRG